MSGFPDTPPTLVDIEALGRIAFQSIPWELRRHTTEVVIRVEDFPDTETEEEMELESPFDLLGLYRGISLRHKSWSDPTPQSDMIFLYRRPILDLWCESGDELLDIVRHVLIHEIGHHFGLSDEDMQRLEDQAEAEAAEKDLGDMPRA
ncbi:MAG: metallopeptidase family protein [Alphaproteobacteria bacterium]|nr:metallopeptidase family protein [Alphaproteobacteria bacterium]